MNTILKQLAFILFLQIILFFYPCNSQAEDTADWMKSQQDVKTVLLDQQIPINEIVAKSIATIPSDAQKAMFKLNILTRAGMNKEAIDALRELKSLHPHMENYQITMIYYDVCDYFAAWDVAKAIVENYADTISELGLQNCLLEHLSRTGWTFEQIDAWLAGMPEGQDNFWIKQRLSFNAQYGRTDELLKKLSSSVRENPQDIEGVIAYLDVLTHLGPQERQSLDLSWISEMVHPESAAQIAKIASLLQSLKLWESAVEYYAQAIDIPLTHAEVNSLSMMQQMVMSGEKYRAIFAVNLRESMAECLLRSGHNDEAQKRMEEANVIRQENNLDMNALLAGRVQQASGQRTIEEQIEAKEKFSEHDPEYWRQKAMYYQGRNEPNHQEEALLRGLALTVPQPKPERGLKGYQDLRSVILSDYVRFLQNQNQTEKAVTLLRKEMKESPALAESSERSAALLGFEYKKYLKADDPILWNWLADRPIWDYTEERLLWGMLENVAAKDMDRHFASAEILSLGKNPTRAGKLGWIMNRMGYSRRSIPLLKYAVEKTNEKNLKEEYQFTLFESYLDTGDWKNAEDIFPLACCRLTTKEIPVWYSKISLLAAKSGNKTDAMRIWKQMANLSPYYLSGLESLVANGMKADLIQFYQKMHETLPMSEIPSKALMILAK